MTLAAGRPACALDRHDFWLEAEELTLSMWAVCRRCGLRCPPWTCPLCNETPNPQRGLLQHRCRP